MSDGWRMVDLIRALRDHVPYLALRTTCLEDCLQAAWREMDAEARQHFRDQFQRSGIAEHLGLENKKDGTCPT